MAYKVILNNDATTAVEVLRGTSTSFLMRVYDEKTLASLFLTGTTKTAYIPKDDKTLLEKTVDPVDSTSGRVTLTPSETAALKLGTLPVVVKVDSSGNITIAQVVAGLIVKDVLLNI